MQWTSTLLATLATVASAQGPGPAVSGDGGLPSWPTPAWPSPSSVTPCSISTFTTTVIMHYTAACPMPVQSPSYSDSNPPMATTSTSSMWLSHSTPASKPRSSWPASRMPTRTKSYCPRKSSPASNSSSTASTSWSQQSTSKPETTLPPTTMSTQSPPFSGQPAPSSAPSLPPSNIAAGMGSNGGWVAFLACGFVAAMMI